MVPLFVSDLKGYISEVSEKPYEPIDWALRKRNAQMVKNSALRLSRENRDLVRCLRETMQKEGSRRGCESSKSITTGGLVSLGDSLTKLQYRFVKTKLFFHTTTRSNSNRG